VKEFFYSISKPHLFNATFHAKSGSLYMLLSAVVEELRELVDYLSLQMTAFLFPPIYPSGRPR